MSFKLGQRQFKQEFDNNVVPIHDPVNPAEIYKGDSITASIEIDETRAIKAQVYRLSPLGVELIVENGILSQINVGDNINLSLQIGGSVCSFEGIKVATLQDGATNTLMGFRWCSQGPGEKNSSERRENIRWMCGEHYLPTGISPNPARFNDFIYFAVRDISLQGMQLSTSLRNKFLVPGMVLDSTLSFPLIGQVNTKIKIVNARIITTAGKDTLGLGVQFLQKQPSVDECIGQYLLQFGPGLTVKDLKQSGLKIKSTDDVVSYSFVKSADDYRSVLDLRHKAYANVGKADKDAEPEVMSDMFDTQSRILMAKHAGKTIGSWRITFHTPEEQNEYDQFVTFPENFPRRDEIVVLSRICTDPSYRGSDLFYGMMRQCLIASLQSKRRYVLGGCSDELLPLYKKVGFVPWGIYYEHGGLKKVREQIIVADSINIITGKDVDIGVWNEIYSDLTDYLSQVVEVPFDPAMNFRIAAYKSLAPFAKLFNIFGSKGNR